MFARAVVAFLVLPGTVGFLLPFFLLRPEPPDRSFRIAAIAPLTIGTFLLLWCLRDFYVAGKGTLAPWAPPRNLVIVGLYRWSRNPMYIAVSLVLLGWATAYWSRPLLMYAFFMMIVFNLRVVLFEEPWLARTHGEAWQRYRARVPRWLF
jgi:protein-S-isoprenylcysteine O-methyltransferase Ste14